MTIAGRRRTVRDNKGNAVYLTEERWLHIVDPMNHPELADYEEYLKITVKKGHRRQEVLNPRKYRYVRQFEDLPDDMNHVVVITLFGFDVEKQSEVIPDNFIVTAFFKHIRSKDSKQ